MPTQKRVALCDDHTIFRSGLRRLLEDDPTVEFVGEAQTADEAVNLATHEQVDIFIMDVSLPGESGIAATRRIREVSPPTKVLVLTMHEDVTYLRKAFDAGAVGYVLKSAADIELRQALQAVSDGLRYVQPAMGAALAEAKPEVHTGRVHELTERESEILRMLALGHTSAEIAAKLYLSGRTVETYRSKIQVKLGVRSRAEMVQIARDAGLLDTD